MTKRLAESGSRLRAVMSIRHVADYFGLKRKTVNTEANLRPWLCFHADRRRQIEQPTMVW